MSQERKTVEVDKRKLVENILSQYSEPSQIFRELIQNADDANAEKVEIYFFTENDQLEDTARANVTKWLIRDNGRGLVGNDEWVRLRTIARGNEDPEKVGAFGVGFYIVLGVCDRPILKSHGHYLEMTMSHGDEPEPLSWEEGECCRDGWTTIELVLKEEGSTRRLPNLISLARFLISSIAFLENINTITVFLCDREVLCIKKPKNVGSEPLAHVRDVIGSPGKFTIKSIDFTTRLISVDATGKEILGELKEPVAKTSRLRALPPSAGTANQTTSSQPPSKLTMKSFSAEYCLYTAQLEAPGEMQQVKSRVKDFPCSFSCQAIYFNAEQQIAVEQCLMKDLFHGLDGLLPSNNSGRIFVGQSTKELTNIGLHIATKHLVTDMVRGSIQLGYDSTGWNESLLNAAGHLARAVYEQEMKKSKRAVNFKELALSTMRQFSWHQDLSSHSIISQHLRTGFFSEPKPSVFSNFGICHVSIVRRYEKRLHAVLKNIPHLDTGLSSQEQELIESTWGVQQISIGEILAEFTSRPGRLSEAAIAGIFDWWQDEPQYDDPSEDEELKKRFIAGLRFNGQLYCEECGVIELEKIKQYTHLIHDKKLLPPDTIYIDETPNCAGYLKHFGWKLLKPDDWLEFVLAGVGPENPVDDRVLTALAGPHGISNKSSDTWKQAAGRLASFRCINTNRGLQKPCDSYLRIADIWNDVPVANVAGSLTEAVYKSLGVRSRLSWDELLERLEASPATVYTNDRFFPYLADMMAQKELSDLQISDLKTRNVFDSESHGKLAMTALHTPDKLGDILHDLDVPILALRGVNGVSMDLLKCLGVRAYPPLQMVDKWLATPESITVNLAIQCLKENDAGYREEAKKSEVALIPTKKGTLARLNEVCCCPSWEELGFQIISTSLAEYAAALGVEKDPLPDRLIHYLKKETVGEEMMQKWFEKLSQVVPDFKGTQLDELGQIPFIPFAQPHLLSRTLTCLKSCFIKASLPTDKPYLENILPFIGFGDDKDHLLARATNRNPLKTSDIAEAMVACPQDFLKLTGIDGYEKELRDIAKEFDSFNDKLRNDMRISRILLGRRRTQDGSYEERLKSGGEILIGGDTDNLFDFGHAVFIAPKGLETLYEKLGSKRLDGCMVYHAYPGDTDPDTTPPIKPEDIKECAKAFKHAGQSQEWQLDISSCVFQMKTCKALELEKWLDCSPDILPAVQAVPHPRREVGAGFDNDFDGSMILWTVRDHANLYTDTATALCRKLLKTYSGKDVLAMELLLRFEDRRMVLAEDASVSNDRKTVTKTDVQHGIPGQEDRNSISLLSAIPPTPVTSVTQKQERSLKWWKWFSKSGKRRKVISSIDPVELVKQAMIGSEPTLRMANPSEQPRKLFRASLLNPRLRRNDCMRIDTDLEEDETFKRHNIMFHRERNSRCREGLGEVVEEFAKLVINLAGVFNQDPGKNFHIFWKDTDPNLKAFHCGPRPRPIYLNLAHYYEHHYVKQVDHRRVSMDWYLILAHELAHDVSLQHDDLHETAFAWYCVFHLDALRRCFPYQPPLGSTL